MNEQDIRWEQRFRNYIRALRRLEDSVKYVSQLYPYVDSEKQHGEVNFVLNDLIRQGLIQSFEFTHELAWNVIKDYAAYQGNPDVSGSRDATRVGFGMGLIDDGEVWMEMIRSRNKSSHTYDEDTANEIFARIIKDYLPAFLAFKEKMERARSGNQDGLFT